MFTVPLPPGVNPIAVDKYIIYQMKNLNKNFCFVLSLRKGTAVEQWLRFCATNRNVAG
jgi:hypothetical protein